MVPIKKRLLAPMVALFVLAGCASPSAHDRLADASALPETIANQEARIRDAYRFALANPQVLESIPCYCGCVNLGHRNNLECYLKPESTPEQPVFDDHAVPCGVCVDITHDVMEMLDVTDSRTTIRAYIDSNYSQLAPGTDTPYPVENGS